MIPERPLVLSKIASQFTPAERDVVLRELDRYPGDTPGGRARVQLAVLKLAAGDLSQVREWVDVALRDFRDVIAQAVYPRQTAMGFVGMDRLPEVERDRILREDEAQWQAWLAS